MGKFIDLTGQKFGRLTVIERVESAKKKNTIWRCLCDCGVEKNIPACDLKSGHTKSCGCLLREKASKLKTKHKETGTQLYNTWCSMKARCCNRNHEHYKYYGERGITVCDDWKNDFVKFRDWALSNGYSDNLTIDRINVNGNYEPENCRWATKEVQAQNKRIYNRNTSGVKGVSFDKSVSKWRAYIGCHRRLIHLGFFITVKEAAEARQQAEMKYWKEDA